MLKVISDLESYQFMGKKVLVRVDFNVSISNGYVGEDYRIRMILPTIEYLTKRGSKVILASHLGRPKGHESHYSLAPVAQRLSEIMGKTKVRFVNDCVGEIVDNKIKSMNESDILLLENLRFHKEEESDDHVFSKHLASLADVYVNDAFSTSHRKHASTHGAAKLFDIRLAGFNLNKEVEYLSMIKENPVKPFTLVVGGAKIKDKIGALENLLPKADRVLIGGAAAYTFLKAKGIKTGNSPIDNDHLEWATKALSAHNEKISLPVDHVASASTVNPSVT